MRILSTSSREESCETSRLPMYPDPPVIRYRTAREAYRWLISRPRVCGGARDQAGQGRRAKPLVVPKASPRTPIRRRYRAPRARAGPWNRSSTLLRRGKGLLQLQEGPGVRSQPEPLDGRYQAPLQPEPPEGADRGRRRAAARVRVHALPEGRQGREVRAGRLSPARDSAAGPARSL